ncbi:MAG: hypothetical protein H6712_07520 [Myxococcales bacterium]|nr:hypothetical protein [Myxococcales bacterium]MCB9713684.1 hypothetical protein [Myxococcales bacterium]
MLLLVAIPLAACEGEPLRATARSGPSLALAQTPQEPPPPPSAPDDEATARGGYWLGVDLVGPAAAQQAAAAELGQDLTQQDPAEQPPPGIVVGHEALVEDAVRWIDAFAFEPHPELPTDPLALRRVPAPAPAGGLWQRHGAILVAFVISGATPQLRPRAIDWPLDQLAILPPGSTWLPAALVPERAPLFAAPAPAVPPAAEAHAFAHRRGGLFVLGWVDRCIDEPAGPRCLRWAQVVARDGDRFTPGYLPMFQVARRSTWVRGEGPLPRAQLVATGIADGQAQWVLLARAEDNQLHRHTLRAPATADGWPPSTLRVEGHEAIVTLGEQPPQRLPLDASLDARPRERPQGETEDEEHDDQ